MNEKYEMMCGIEIHQQLDTNKLFCSCDSSLCDNGYGSYYRKLRPTTSETGEIDRAALSQFKKHIGYRYQCCDETSCLVELDEEPPHAVNPEAMQIALTFSEMLGASIVDEIHFMRKIVVDGSNASGFQRTSLVAMNGHVDLDNKKFSIISICLEEDAARRIGSNDDEVIYRLDRLGIPLIEVATGPDMRTPEEVMRVAYRLGTLLRATHKVKRGIGTIRQDINISIPGGARVELKGVSDLKMIPDYVRNEVYRQKMLVRVKEILNSRKVKAVQFAPMDVTNILKTCESKIIRSALDKKGVVIAIRLPGFAGVMNGDNKSLRLGSEMAQYARTKGVNGIFHSDELPNYGIEKSYVDNLCDFLGIVDDLDAFMICAANRDKATDALRAAVMRANEAIYGVPEETRDPLPDGTTRYSRPLASAARMYPETDVPPILITEKMLEDIKKNMPELPEQIEQHLIEHYGINQQQARQIIRQGNEELFKKIQSNRVMASIAATMFLNIFSEMEHNNIDIHAIHDQDIIKLFNRLEHGIFAKEALPELIKEMAVGTDVDDAIKKFGIETINTKDAMETIEQIVNEHIDFVRDRGMASVGGLMGPVMNILKGKVDGRRANQLLKNAIKRLIE